MAVILYYLFGAQPNIFPHHLGCFVEKDHRCPETVSFLHNPVPLLEKFIADSALRKSRA
jgi:hypothetical protein